MEKFTDRNIQSVTQLFECADGGAVVSSADNVVDGRLCDTAEIAQSVDRKIAFLT
jgi:hypothetical protein